MKQEANKKGSDKLQGIQDEDSDELTLETVLYH